jgi:hypothetical protein
MLFLQSRLGNKNFNFIIFISKTPTMQLIMMKHVFTNNLLILLFDKFGQVEWVVCMPTQCDSYIPTMVPFVAKNTMSHIDNKNITSWGAGSWVQNWLGPY